MPDLDIPALRAIAEAATPYKWEAEVWPVHGFEDELPPRGLVTHSSSVELWDSSGRNCVASGADATHIAAFDPPMVLALLDRLEHAEVAYEGAMHDLAEKDNEINGLLRDIAYLEAQLGGPE